MTTAPDQHPPAVTITEPGVYDDIPAEDYHADPVPDGSLSSSGARLLLPPGCPALYRWTADHGEEHNRVFDLGHAAHQQVLRAGPELVEVHADDWRTKAARAQRDAAYTAGAVPLLTAELEQVTAMAAALRDHPIAGRLFDPDAGLPEQSLFWRDAEFDVWRRARLDWMRPASPGRRLIVADYKTTNSADPEALGKTMATYGYHLQAQWYRDAAIALNLIGDVDPVFVLVCQEKTPPYLVTVAQPDHAALRYAAMANRKALDIYRRCRDADYWPAYADTVAHLPLPRWAERQHEAAWERGDYDIEESG